MYQSCGPGSDFFQFWLDPDPGPQYIGWKHVRAVFRSDPERIFLDGRIRIRYNSTRIGNPACTIRYNTNTLLLKGILFLIYTNTVLYVQEVLTHFIWYLTYFIEFAHLNGSFLLFFFKGIKNELIPEVKKKLLILVIFYIRYAYYFNPSSIVVKYSMSLFDLLIGHN